MAEIYVKLANGTMQKVHLETDSSQVKGLNDAVKIIKVDNTVSADKLANAKEIKIQDAEGNASTAANFDGSENVSLNLPDTIPNQRQLGYRQPDTAYAVDNIAYHSALPTGRYLECTTPGTSGNGALTISTTTLGTTVSDGTVVWTIGNYLINHAVKVRDLNLASTEGFYSYSESTNTDSPLYGSTGKVVVLTELNVPQRPLQIAIPAGGAQQLPIPFIRRGIDGGSWTDWQRLITESGWNASATMHNSIYRGNNLTSYWNSGQMSTDIQNGDFSNIYPGDYITKSITIDGTTYNNVKFIIMDLDPHLHKGDTETTAHHVAIMPEERLGTAQMNAENTTVGGYLGSAMWTTHIPKVVAGFEAAFGAAHILEHRELLSNAMDANLKPSGYNGWSGASSGWAWTSVKVNLANENMVYGAPVVSSSLHDTGEWDNQLAAFRLNPGLICSKRYWWWLRSVAAASYFCSVGDSGAAHCTGAAYSRGVRPIALLH